MDVTLYFRETIAGGPSFLAISSRWLTLLRFLLLYETDVPQDEAAEDSAVSATVETETPELPPEPEVTVSQARPHWPQP